MRTYLSTLLLFYSFSILSEQLTIEAPQNFKCSGTGIFEKNIILQSVDPNQEAIIFKNHLGKDKARICSAIFDDETGLYISLDEGYTENLSVTEKATKVSQTLEFNNAGNILLTCMGHAKANSKIRVLWATVDQNGNSISSTSEDFSIKMNQLGIYDIAFTPQLKEDSIPFILLSSFTEPINAVVLKIDHSGCTIKTSGIFEVEPNAKPFSFLIIGSVD